MSSVLLVGINHRTASIELRERCALDGDGLREVLKQIGKCGTQQETTILSTCNRLEVYATTGDAQHFGSAVAQYLAQILALDEETMQQHLYFRQDRDAIEHLMRVACGLDSMILGEHQILGQVAGAFAAAQEAATTGPVLSHLFHLAAHCGKRARAETEIGSYTTSLSHAAVQLAASVLGDLRQRQALVVGSGEMAKLAGLALHQHGIGDITFVNRTPSRADQLAQRVNGRALAWRHLAQALVEADVVFSATSAPQPVILREQVVTAMQHRAGRPLMLVDIALPRDIEVTVDEIDNVIRFDIDHLRDRVDANQARRHAAVPLVEEIVAQEVDAFDQWLNGRMVVPALVELRRKAETMATDELARTLRRLDNADAHIEQEVVYLAHRIINKLLHEPTVRLKAQAANGNGAVYAHVLEELFALAPALPDGASGGPNGVSDHG